MIKVLLSVLTLYNSETNTYKTSVVLTESTIEECEINTIITGRSIISNFGGYDTVMVKCVPIEDI